MANKPYNVEDWSYSLDLNDPNIKNANADANYGPWESIEAYMTWFNQKVVPGTKPKEGTLIAVQPTEHADVTLYVYTSNVGDGTWKPVGSGSGGTGTDDIGYVDHNVDVDILEKKVVSTSANQNLTLEQQANARANINAADADDLNAKQDKLSSSTELCTINGSKIYFGSSATIAGGGGSGSNIVIDNSMNRNSSNPVENKVIVNALAEKADKSNTVTTDANNQTISGEMVFEGGVTFDCETDFTSESHFEDVVTFGDNVNIQGSLTLDGNLSAGILKRESTGAVTTTGLKTINSQSIIGDGNITISAGTNVVQADWNAASGEDGFIANKPITVSGTNDENASIAKNLTVGTEQSNKDLTVNGDATITGELSVLDDKITAALSEGQNPVAVLTVDGDLTTSRTFTQTLQVYNNTTLGTATTQSQDSNSSTVINGSLTLADIAGTNGGVLRVDSNGAVYADPSSYITGSIMVDTYDDLPTSGIEPGEVRFIRDTGKISTALQVVADTKLYVSIPNVYVTEANANKRVLEEMCTEERPLVQYSTFLNNFSEIVDEHNAEDVYGDYPAIPYREHKLTESAGDDLYVIPVQHDTYGKIMIAISKVSGKAWIVPTSSVGAINTWYVDEVGSTGGLSTGSLIEITDNYDDLPDDLTNVREFMTFGGSVIWSK